MINYPATTKQTISEEHFGQKISDPYRWLEDDHHPEVDSWVHAQRKLTQDYLNQLAGYDDLKNRLRDYYNYTKYSDLMVVGENIIYSENQGLTAQPIYYIQRGIDATAQVLVDPNQFSADGTVAITLNKASQDHRYLSYLKAESGSDWQQIKVIDLTTLQHLEDTLRWVKFTLVAWYQDGFFYSRYDAPKTGGELSDQNKDMKIYYHRLGEPQQKDQLIYQEAEHPLRYHSLDVSQDQKHFVLLSSEGTYGNQVKYKPAGFDGPFITLYPGFNQAVDFLGAKDELLYFKTDLDAPNGKVVAYETKTKSMSDIIVAQNKPLEWAKKIDDVLIAHFNKDVVSDVAYYDLSGKSLASLKLPMMGNVYHLEGSAALPFYLYSFGSFIEPTGLYMADKKTGKTKPFKCAKLKFNSADYTTEQHFIKSKDGTKIPVFLTHRKDLKKNAKNPTLLYAYGGFNISLPPAFDPSMLYLLAQGGIYAQANLRGGGEYGEDWHKAGMRHNKQNVFDDFIAVAEGLIEMGYTSKEQLAIQGRSNGGLLIGAVVNQRPDLFSVAFPQVGVLDMLRYHKFTIGWGWVVEYGNPEEEGPFHYIYKYSPLHNIQKTDYPAVMVMTADHDDRVVPAHSYKYTATLQEKNQSKAPILIRIDQKSGHGMGRSVEKLIAENADKYAFMFANIGREQD